MQRVTVRVGSAVSSSQTGISFKQMSESVTLARVVPRIRDVHGRVLPKSGRELPAGGELNAIDVRDQLALIENDLDVVGPSGRKTEGGVGGYGAATLHGHDSLFAFGDKPDARHAVAIFVADVSVICHAPVMLQSLASSIVNEST